MKDYSVASSDAFHLVIVYSSLLQNDVMKACSLVIILNASLLQNDVIRLSCTSDNDII